MSRAKRKHDSEKTEIEVEWKVRVNVTAALGSLTNLKGVYLITKNHTPIYVGEAKWGYLKRWTPRLEVFKHANVLSQLAEYYVHCGDTNGVQNTAIAESLLTNFVEKSQGYDLFNRTNRESYKKHVKQFELSHSGYLPQVLTDIKPAKLVGRSQTLNTVGVQHFDTSTVEGDRPEYTVNLRWAQITDMNNAGHGFPDGPGLYAIVNQDDDKFYIGKAQDEDISGRWTARLAGFPNFGLSVKDVFASKNVIVYCAVFAYRRKREKAAIGSAERILIDYIFNNHAAKTTNAHHPMVKEQDEDVTVNNLNLGRLGPLSRFLPATIKGR